MCIANATCIEVLILEVGRRGQPRQTRQTKQTSKQAGQTRHRQDKPDTCTCTCMYNKTCITCALHM